MEIKISTSDSGTSIVSKRELVSPNNPVLKTITPEFNFKNPPMHPIKLANELVDVLQQNGGLGLAAPQVGYPHRVFVMGMGDKIIACFNPRILEYSKETDFLEEGCLSFPGLFIKIRRPKNVHVAYQDYNGVHREAKYSGLTSRVFQHETDHVNGLLYTDIADKLSLDIARRKQKKHNRR